MTPVTLLWFREGNLRLADNPALQKALADDQVVIPVFIMDPATRMGAASRWWLHYSLKSLSEDLKRLDVPLILLSGDSCHVLSYFAENAPLSSIITTEATDPAGQDIENRVLKVFGERLQTVAANLLYQPSRHLNQQGKPFQVFTPFWKALTKSLPELALSSPPEKWPQPEKWPKSDTLDDLALLPTIPWDTTMRETWHIGEAGAAKALDHFLDTALTGYDERRNRPDKQGTSQLSPYLHFGEISIHRVWQQTRTYLEKHPKCYGDGQKFLAELGWREFAHYLLHYFPETVTQPLRTEFKRFPWAENADGLKAWQHGQTGYPIVDAGMRQLWATGWMHNRVRMIVASFLVKHLRLSWQAGAEWFWDTLVDADCPNNTLGWQWSAGCGADAAPYFRVFNPMLQGEKFDPAGEYVRQWVPELAELPDKLLHQPWVATAEQLSAAGVRLGKTYPKPLVEHTEARAMALQAFQSLKNES